jgi:hypothetical protein
LDKVSQENGRPESQSVASELLPKVHAYQESDDPRQGIEDIHQLFEESGSSKCLQEWPEENINQAVQAFEESGSSKCLQEWPEENVQAMAYILQWARATEDVRQW